MCVEPPLSENKDRLTDPIVNEGLIEGLSTCGVACLLKDRSPCFLRSVVYFGFEKEPLFKRLVQMSCNLQIV